MVEADTPKTMADLLAENAALRAEVERLRSHPAQVKPLEWFDFEWRGARAYAFYRATYMISFWHSQGQFEVALSYPGYQTNYDGERWHDTIEAAKAAAQADYEARIRAALREGGE